VDDNKPVELNEFKYSISDDIDIPAALTHLWNLTHQDIGYPEILRAVFDMDTVLGLGLYKEANAILQHPERKEIKQLILQREKKRKEKNFKEADNIREKLSRKYDVVLEDSAGKTTWMLDEK
jgi:cysteinyl-tRNA synthetase